MTLPKINRKLLQVLISEKKRLLVLEYSKKCGKKMKLFQLLTIVSKLSTWDVWGRPDFTSESERDSTYQFIAKWLPLQIIFAKRPLLDKRNGLAGKAKRVFILRNDLLILEVVIWSKVFKNGSSKICGRQPLKNLKWCGLLRQTISLQFF